jgi:hypothetical protein
MCVVLKIKIEEIVSHALNNRSLIAVGLSHFTDTQDEKPYQQGLPDEESNYFNSTT